MKKNKEYEEIWLHTQNTRRFPGFAVVVVTFFRRILNEFHDISECVSFESKINNPFWWSPIFRRKVTIFIGRETKTYVLLTKINEKNSLESAPL